MGGPKSEKRMPFSREQRRTMETREIDLLNSWIESGKPTSGSNSLAAPSPPDNAPVGRTKGGGFSPYVGCQFFRQLPLSKKTQAGIRPKYTGMTEIQRASLPHSLCGRDILGAAKTGSGKSLAFIIPVIEKLYRASWGPEDGVGSIIISPTKELAGQLFDELKMVGKEHAFSAGLLIGGRKDVDTEKECINTLNILVCTPGRLLQHMDETPNFECSQLQILVLDEADRILDAGFKKELDAIVSQFPKQRQTLLFSATQTKSVKDLARLSLKDPEYISVHAESVTATPDRLKQLAIEVPLDQKLTLLWSFIKRHLDSKIIVFLTTCKQVKFVYETFKKLRPGIPLLCLHGRMKQIVRMAIYEQFCEKTSVLFSTDVAARGLDFPSINWVIQVDCPDDIATYIHRVGRTARFTSNGKSVLFFTPSEKEMFRRLRSAKPKIPIKFHHVNTERLQPISGLLSSLLVKYPNLQQLAKRAFETYLRSIRKQRDKEVFDVLKLPIEEYAASLGLPMTPKIRFINQMKGQKVATGTSHQQEDEFNSEAVAAQRKKQSNAKIEEMEDDILIEKKNQIEVEMAEASMIQEKKQKNVDQREAEDHQRAPKIKKKKLKINLNKPIGTRVKFDEDGNVIPPLATIAGTEGGDGMLQLDKVTERYKKLKDEMRKRDKEDKLLQRQRLCEKRIKEKIKIKRGRDEEDTEDAQSDLEKEARNGIPKKQKIYYDSADGDNDVTNGNKGLGFTSDSVSISEQEALALKLLLERWGARHSRAIRWTT